MVLSTDGGESVYDRARVRIRAGDGGNGAITFRREKYVPRGGPEGGDGGKGGDVVFRVSASENTLLRFQYVSEFKAASGGNGRKSRRHGKDGEDLVVPVPPGTVVRDADTNEPLADLTVVGDEFRAARGGRGGLGNQHFATSARQAPRIAEKGEPGEERTLALELKLIADVGLVGYPNVGKSTLLAAMSAARPKIADYPFTTLEPILGVVEVDGRTLVLADMPGLIEGAAEGTGLGHEFLRHVERTRLLVHVLDGSGGPEGRSPLVDLEVIERELERYGAGLAAKASLVAVNKADLEEARERLPELRVALERRGLTVVAVSAATGFGVRELSRELRRRLDLLAASAPPVEVVSAPRRYTLETSADERHIEVERLSRHHFQVVGVRLQRLSAMTDFANEEAAERFQHVLEASGAARRLQDQGIEAGDIVHLGDHELVWGEQEGEADRTRAGGRHRRRG